MADGMCACLEWDDAETRPSPPVHTPRRLEGLLVGLAISWIVAVALISVAGPSLTPAEVGASPDVLVEGDVWRLLSSAMIVEDDLPLLQVAVLAAVTAVVIVRHGAIVWWLAALLGHVGSALLAYALIGAAAAFGSASAERFEDDWDYGTSCVLAALVGVLFAGAARRLRSARGGTSDVGLVVLASLGLLAWLVTLDWYGVEHLLAFAIGACVLIARESR